MYRSATRIPSSVILQNRASQKQQYQKKRKRKGDDRKVFLIMEIFGEYTAAIQGATITAPRQRARTRIEPIQINNKA